MQKDDNNIKLVTFLPLFVGMLFGVLIYVVCHNDFFAYFDNSLMSNISHNYILYIVKERLVQICLFVFIACVISYYFSAILFCGFFGTAYGFLYSHFFVLYFLKGIGINFVLFLPFLLSYFWCIYLFGVFFVRENTCNCNNVNKLFLLFKTFVIIVLLALGVGLELYLHNFFKLFFSICSVS